MKNHIQIPVFEKNAKTLDFLIDKTQYFFESRVVNWSLEPYRVWTSSRRAMPNFIIIGSQKCGTSSLYNYLIQHPDIQPAFKKELHFFDVNFHKGSDWYRSRFPLGRRNIITGEATPSYIFHPYAPTRIAEMTPSVKVIAILRNPVDRAYSHYNHNLRKKRETLSFEIAIQKEEERLSGKLKEIIENEKYFDKAYFHYSYLKRGLYFEQLKKWFGIFSKNQTLVLKSEDFYVNPAASFSEVLEFLELPQWKLKEYKRFNGLDYQGMNGATREQLVDYFKPHNQELTEFLGMSFDWDK